ncbi:MAG: phosphatase PAP2 family protein [Acidobacteriota bacterium]
MSQLEIPVCRFCHELSSLRVKRFFSAISKIGDGHYWYVGLGLLLLTQGAAALPAFVHLLTVGLLCHVLYKSLKRRTARLRPADFAADGFQLTVPPLDKYSFPSGHTLHAVAFAIVLTAYLPAAGWLVVPFAVLVALSRLVLALHYPTDVAAGALLGALLAASSFHLSTFQALAESAF